MIAFIVILIALSGSSLLAAGSETCREDGSTTNWKIVEQSEGITLYERWVTVNEDLEVRERKGVFTVHATVEQAVDLICNAELAPSWMSGVSDSYVIRQESETDWYAYTFYSIPWPFDDRDLVSHNTLMRDDSRGSAIIYMQSEEGIIQEEEDVQRLRNYTASWEVTPVGDNLTRITFLARSDEPPAFPRWIMDPIVKNAFIQNLENLKSMLDAQLTLNQ